MDRASPIRLTSRKECISDNEPGMCNVPAPIRSIRTLSSENQMRLALLTAFVIIVLPATTRAQSAGVDVSPLQAGVGTRILEPAAGSSYELVPVASATPARFRYSVDRSLATRSVAWQQIGKMDASTGSHRHTGRGLLVGLVVGVIGGVVQGRLANPGEMGRGYNEVVGAVGFGAIGAVCGAIVGYAWRSEN